MAKEIEKAIAAVLFQMAEKAVKAQRYEEGAVAYLALVKRYPLVSFADKAVFEAGVAYENAKQHDKAAETFMILPKQYASSSLTIKGILRAASNYKKGGKPQQAATTFLFITNNFPQDSMAFQAIGFAAQTYDSIPDKKNAAVTFELAYKRYPKHEKTPAFLYSACLSYDEAKMTDEAIRCSKDLVRDYPKSTYALDAAFSIPVAYGNAKKWDLAAQEYHFFIKNYGNDDKEKLIAAYIGAARAYMELKEEEKAVEDYRKTLEAYDKYGLQIKNADPGVPAEAAFYLGEHEYHKMEPIVLKEYVSLTFPMDYKHTLGFSFFENGASIDDGPSYGEYAFMFGYAYNLMQFLALGVDISVLYINQFDEVKQLTLGADVGVSWNPLASSKYGYLLVGVALQNALQPAVSTAVEEDGMKFVLFTESEAYKIPSNLNISFFYRGLNRALEAKVELSIIDVMHESSEGGEGMNLEQSFTLTGFSTRFLPAVSTRLPSGSRNRRASARRS